MRNANGPEIHVGSTRSYDHFNHYGIPVTLQFVTGVLPAETYFVEFNCRSRVEPSGSSDIDDARISAIALGSG